MLGNSELLAVMAHTKTSTVTLGHAHFFPNIAFIFLSKFTWEKGLPINFERIPYVMWAWMYMKKFHKHINWNRQYHTFLIVSAGASHNMHKMKRSESQKAGWQGQSTAKPHGPADGLTAGMCIHREEGQEGRAITPKTHVCSCVGKENAELPRWKSLERTACKTWGSELDTWS